MPKFSSSDFQRPNFRAKSTAAVGAQQAIGQTTGAQLRSQGPQAAQSLGAQTAAQEGAATAQQMQQKGQVRAKRGQIGINKFATQQRATMARKRDNANRTALESRQAISQMGRDLEQKLFNDRLQFEYDQRGIRFANERQLADFKKMVAKDDEEYQNFAQQMQQRSTEKRKLLQIAHAKISQELSLLSRARESEANFQHKKKLIAAKARLDKKIKAEANRAKNRAMIFQGVGMVAGAAIGIPGGPAGVALGAQAGAAGGTALAGATS